MNRCPVCALPVVSVTPIEDGWHSYRCLADCTPQTLMTKKTYPHASKIAPDSGDETMKWIPSSIQSPPEDGYIFACFTLQDDEDGASYFFCECRRGIGKWWERNARKPLPYSSPSHWMIPSAPTPDNCYLLSEET